MFVLVIHILRLTNILYFLSLQLILNFTGYEQFLPKHYFTFDGTEILTNTSSDLFTLAMHNELEFLLPDGIDDPICSKIPPQSEVGDMPIFAKMLSGDWLQWTPSLLLEDNGPSINDDNKTANVLSDGGGQTVIDTDEKTRCANVPRTFSNEDTCFLSTSSTACSAAVEVGEVPILLDPSNIKAFYTFGERYVYAIQGLELETLEEHPCNAAKSRWAVTQTICPNPTQLATNTTAILVSLECVVCKLGCNLMV